MTCACLLQGAAKHYYLLGAQTGKSLKYCFLQASLALMEAYKDPLLITHPRGTNVKVHTELKGTPDYNAIAGLTMGIV